MDIPHSTLKDILKNQTGIEDLETCWLKGYKLAQKEGRENANPYKQNSLENQYWTDGWWAGFYNEAPLFSSDVVEAMHEEEQNLSSNKKPGISKFNALLCSLGAAAGIAAIYSFELLEFAA